MAIFQDILKKAFDATGNYETSLNKAFSMFKKPTMVTMNNQEYTVLSQPRIYKNSIDPSAKDFKHSELSFSLLNTHNINSTSVGGGYNNWASTSSTPKILKDQYRDMYDYLMNIDPIDIKGSIDDDGMDNLYEKMHKAKKNKTLKTIDYSGEGYNNAINFLNNRAQTNVSTSSSGPTVNVANNTSTPIDNLNKILNKTNPERKMWGNRNFVFGDNYINNKDFSRTVTEFYTNKENAGKLLEKIARFSDLEYSPSDFKIYENMFDTYKRATGQTTKEVQQQIINQFKEWKVAPEEIQKHFRTIKDAAKEVGWQGNYEHLDYSSFNINGKGHTSGKNMNEQMIEFAKQRQERWNKVKEKAEATRKKNKNTIITRKNRNHQLETRENARLTQIDDFQKELDIVNSEISELKKQRLKANNKDDIANMTQQIEKLRQRQKGLYDNITRSRLGGSDATLAPTLELMPPREGAPMFEGGAVPSTIANDAVFNQQQAEQTRKAFEQKLDETKEAIVNNANVEKPSVPERNTRRSLTAEEQAAVDKANAQWRADNEARYADMDKQIENMYKADDIVFGTPEQILDPNYVSSFDPLEETIESTMNAAEETINQTSKSTPRGRTGRQTGRYAKQRNAERQSTKNRGRSGNAKGKTGSTKSIDELHQEVNRRKWANEQYAKQQAEQLNKYKQTYEDILDDWKKTSGNFSGNLANRNLKMPDRLINNGSNSHQMYTEAGDYYKYVEDANTDYYRERYTDGSYTMDEQVFKYTEGEGVDGKTVLKNEGELIDNANEYAQQLDDTLKNAKNTMSPEDFEVFRNGYTPETTIRRNGNTPELKQRKVLRNSHLIESPAKFGTMDTIMSGINILGAVGDYKAARRKGHGVISSAVRAGTQFAVYEALGAWAIPASLLQHAPGAVIKGADILYKENRKMNSAANFQVFGDAQFMDTQQLATMRQSGMEMAKMAQYNLQQTLMGNEATYLHR